MQGVIEIVTAPELDCAQWGTKTHSTGEPTVSPDVEQSTWVAADATHVAIGVNLRGSSSGGEQPSFDRWTQLVDAIGADGPISTQRYEVEEIELGAAQPPPSVRYLYAVRMDVQPAAEDEFNDWYTTDHIANLSQVPGVHSARRFVASNDDRTRKYVALYYLDCPSVRQTAAWQRAAHTDWSIAIRAHHVGKLATMFVRADIAGRHPA